MNIKSFFTLAEPGYFADRHGTWRLHGIHQRLKVIKAEMNLDTVQLNPGECDGAGCVGTRDGAVRLNTVQPEGKGAMEAAAWLRGRSGQEIIQFS